MLHTKNSLVVISHAQCKSGGIASCLHHISAFLANFVAPKPCTCALPVRLTCLSFILLHPLNPQVGPKRSKSDSRKKQRWFQVAHDLLFRHGIVLFAVIAFTSQIVRRFEWWKILLVLAAFVLLLVLCVHIFDSRLLLYRVVIADEVLVALVIELGIFLLIMYVGFFLGIYSFLEGYDAVVKVRTNTGMYI